MREDHRFQKQKGMTPEQKRLIPVIVLPLLAIVLIVVIIVADHKESKTVNVDAVETEIQETQQMPESESETLESEEETALPDDALLPGEEPETEETAAESTEAESTEAETEEATGNLKKDSIPEVVSVMKRYFEARSEADAETINELYGITDVSADVLEAQKTRLMSNSKYIRDFTDVVTYVMQGPVENNWLVYTECSIRFYTAQTKAPMIMWCFIEKDAEGNYRILDNSALSSAYQEYADGASRSDEVRKLAGDVNARLDAALNEDEDLKTVYGVLHSGSPIYQEETQAEVVIVEEAATETETETAGDTVPETETETEAAAETQPQ